MYRLPEVALAATASAQLATLQGKVDAVGGYPQQVAEAKRRFASKPQPLFRKVRSALEEMSGSLVRCSYCEDSAADEVEHILPKDFYPDRVFAWTNYVFSCGPCNGGKNNKAGVFLPDGSTADLRAHRQAQGIVPPPAGTALFINPRLDEPLDFLWLDLMATFAFVVLDEDAPEPATRARATIDFLALNRPLLLRSRKNAFGGYLDRLAQYIAVRDAGAAPAELASREAELKVCPHRTVWLEMKRQRDNLSNVGALFAQAPEALAW